MLVWVSEVELVEGVPCLRGRLHACDDAERGGDGAFLLCARDSEAVGVVVADGQTVLLARVRVDVRELEVSRIQATRARFKTNLKKQGLASYLLDR